MRSVLTLALCVLLSGCAGFGSVMGSPEQLKELIKVKDAACTKVVGVYMGATITLTAINVDKGVPGTHGGTVKINADCATEISVADAPARKLAP